MGVIESVRGVLWARKRRPEEVAYGISLAHERFSPPELLEQAKEAERAGFDAVCCSDHLGPWWDPSDGPPAHCGNAWVWLGAAGAVTQRVSLGPAVTAIVHRYNPVVVAQQVATLETMCPGRAFLGVGSGEAMNEVPAGMQWSSVAEQLERTAEALTIIKRLLDGETVDSTVGTSGPRPPGCTSIWTAGRPSTCPPSGPTRRRSLAAWPTASGRWPTPRRRRR